MSHSYVTTPDHSYVTGDSAHDDVTKETKESEESKESKRSRTKMNESAKADRSCSSSKQSITWEEWLSADPSTALELGAIAEEKLRQDWRVDKPSSLPVYWHIVACWRVHIRRVDGEDDADETRWQSPLWTFIRAVKNHPKFVDLTARDAMETIEYWLGVWPQVNGDSLEMLWEDWFDVGREDAQVEILDSWDKVRLAAGEDVVNAAMDRAEQRPIAFDPGHITLHTDGYKPNPQEPF